MKVYKERKGMITFEVGGEEIKIEEYFEHYCSNGSIIGWISFYINNKEFKERNEKGWIRDCETEWRKSKTPAIMKYYEELDKEMSKFVEIANKEGILEAMLRTKIR